MDKQYMLNDVIPFGEFIGMSVKEAADESPKSLFKMQNGTIFNLDAKALEYLKEAMK